MNIVSFADILEAMNAVARGECEPNDELVAQCRAAVIEDCPRKTEFSAWREFLTRGKCLSKALNFLRATNWLSRYPELERLVGCQQDPEWHPEGDVWNHTLCCLDAFAKDRDRRQAGEREDLIVGFAVLCHDFGKPFCTRYDPKKKRIRSLGHDEEGVKPAQDFLKRLTDDEYLLKAVPPLVRLHMRPFAMWKSKASVGAIRRVMAQSIKIERLLRVAAADDEGRPPFPSETADLVWLAQEVKRIETEDSKPKPIVMGRNLIEVGLKPGPEFKRMLDVAYSAQLRGEFSDIQGGLRFLNLEERATGLCQVNPMC